MRIDRWNQCVARLIGVALLMAMASAAPVGAAEDLPPIPGAAVATDSVDDSELDEGSDEDSEEGDDLDKLLDMDLDQLSQVKVTTQEFSSAALTEVRTEEGGRSVSPAAITTISREDIYRSGARGLNELLEIYVPNFQWVLHHWEQSHIGLRGVISDREDKYLLLVNGRIMNDKTHYGAASERELPQLGDIHHIDVVRGPGSAIYGPGAVSMVIAIYTETAETFTGTRFHARQGFIDEYSTLELTHAFQWDCAEGGMLFYAGVGSRDGADQDYAPLVFGTSDPGWPGDGDTTVEYQDYIAETNVQNEINHYNEAFDNLLPLKFFIDYKYEDLEIWARYTRGGVQYATAPTAGLFSPAGYGNYVTELQNSTGTQQATLHSKYETEIHEDLKFIATLGFDHSEFARTLFVGPTESYAEEELNGRAVFVSTLGDHQIAYGGEIYYDWFGLESHLLPVPPTNGRLGADFTPWSTQTYSALFEDQWQINDEWTTFMGGRWDKNTYTGWMYSPKAAVVYTPDDKTAWKLLLNRSQRMNFAEELRAQWLSNRTDGQPEILRSYELRLERSPTECFNHAMSIFYLDLDAIAWNGVTNSSTLTGNQTQYGIEYETYYKHGCWTLQGSHSFSKLIKFTRFDPTVTPFITASPDGYGNDLNNWSNHITKLFVQCQLTPKLSSDTSLRYYWGFAGAKDVQDRANAGGGAFGATRPDWDRPYLDSVFLNHALNYRVDRNIRLRLEGYNLLGMFQNTLNKRIYGGEGSYRVDPAAVGLSCEMTY
ncbi:TonB-dependent receptor plug domain-containing protein [Pseudobythopirellula maris]|nr:TonB-dependent receptor [Pseudobythopirellula maris]